MTEELALPELPASLPRLAPEEAAALGTDIDRARQDLARLQETGPWES